MPAPAPIFTFADQLDNSGAAMWFHFGAILWDKGLGIRTGPTGIVRIRHPKNGIRAAGTNNPRADCLAERRATPHTPQPPDALRSGKPRVAYRGFLFCTGAEGPFDCEPDQDRALRMHLGRVLEMAELSPDKAIYEQKINERFGIEQQLDLPIPMPLPAPTEAAN